MCKPSYALTAKGDKISVESAISSQEYICPNCKNLLKIRKGKTGKYFYHVPRSKSNESKIHLEAKRGLLTYLQKEIPNGDWAEERYIKLIKARPDISGRINGKPVIFEIQHSPLTASELNRRTLKYSELGIYTVWVIPEEEFRRNPKAYEKYLHALYKGNLFLWSKKEGLKVAHFFYKTKTRREIVYKNVSVGELHFTNSSTKIKVKGLNLPDVKIMTIYKWWSNPPKDNKNIFYILLLALVMILLLLFLGIII